MSQPTEAQLQEWLNNGEERPVIVLLRLHRVLAIASLLLFVAALVLTRKRAPYAGVVVGTFTVCLVASLIAKYTARYLDRRLMRRFAEKRWDES